MRVALYSGVRDALSNCARRPDKIALLHPATLCASPRPNPPASGMRDEPAASRARRSGGHDLVLCSFETLRSELYHAAEPSAEWLGRASRSGGGSGGGRQHLRSPLLALRWWRVVVDEAQMVECASGRAAAMARQIDGVHRCASRPAWTGVPRVHPPHMAGGL